MACAEPIGLRLSAVLQHLPALAAELCASNELVLKLALFEQLREHVEREARFASMSASPAICWTMSFVAGVEEVIVARMPCRPTRICYVRFWVLASRMSSRQYA